MDSTPYPGRIGMKIKTDAYNPLKNSNTASMNCRGWKNKNKCPPLNVIIFEPFYPLNKLFRYLPFGCNFPNSHFN
jgi:hypothetical protein